LNIDHGGDETQKLNIDHGGDETRTLEIYRHPEVSHAPRSGLEVKDGRSRAKTAREVASI